VSKKDLRATEQRRKPLDTRFRKEAITCELATRVSFGDIVKLFACQIWLIEWNGHQGILTLRQVPQLSPFRRNRIRQVT
jgi:hypothetical protein